MVSHDITFCASTKCPNIDTCRRAHPPSDVAWLSFGDFYEEGHECSAYWPMVFNGEVRGASRPAGEASSREAATSTGLLGTQER